MCANSFSNGHICENIGCSGFSESSQLGLVEVEAYGFQLSHPDHGSIGFAAPTKVIAKSIALFVVPGVAAFGTSGKSNILSITDT